MWNRNDLDDVHERRPDAPPLHRSRHLWNTRAPAVRGRKRLGGILFCRPTLTKRLSPNSRHLWSARAAGVRPRTNVRTGERCCSLHAPGGQVPSVPRVRPTTLPTSATLQKKPRNGFGRPHHHHHSSLVSSLFYSHVNLEWCDKIKHSNLLETWSSWM